jgi:hypothetical protein
MLREGGIDFILTDFINTINSLNEIGFDFESVHYFGFLAFCIEDSLALHWLGGFLEGVGRAKRFCRNCEKPYSDRQNYYYPNEKYEDRSMEKHLAQIEFLNHQKTTDFIQLCLG